MYLQAQQERVEAALDLYLPAPDAPPPALSEAMRYSVFAGGKRVRPILLLAAAGAVGGDSDSVLPAACAMEFVHTYSLIHDDLPAMDDDDYRRGKPTSHKVFGEAVAILAGDALLTHAFDVMTCPVMQARFAAPGIAGSHAPPGARRRFCRHGRRPGGGHEFGRPRGVR